MDVNADKEKKDLPKDSDISRLFLGEEQDPKSKFKSGGSDQTLLRLWKSLLSEEHELELRAASHPQGDDQKHLFNSPTTNIAQLLVSWCKGVLWLAGKTPQGSQLSRSLSCAPKSYHKEQVRGIYSSPLLPGLTGCPRKQTVNHSRLRKTVKAHVRDAVPCPAVSVQGGA